jgi:glutamyl-tRNA reductase
LTRLFLTQLFAIGINHQTAPVSLRERVAFADHALPAALAALRALPSEREVALLSTSHRTELYAVADDQGNAL